MYLKDIDWAKVTKADVDRDGTLRVHIRGSQNPSVRGKGWHSVRLPRLLRGALRQWIHIAQLENRIIDPFPVGPMRQFSVLLENHTDSRDNDTQSVMARTEEEALYIVRQSLRPGWSASRVLRKGE